MQQQRIDRVLCTCLGLLCLLFVPFVTAAEPEKIELIGSDLATWQSDAGEWALVGEAQKSEQDPQGIATSPGTGVLVNGPTGKTKNVHSRVEHGDVAAHIEFMVPKGSNSGVYFQGRYEIQILDSYGVEQPKYGDCGGVYRAAEFAGRPPRTNASRAPGEWQTFDVVFQAPRFDASGKKTANAKFVKVVHNGVVIHEHVEVPRSTIAASFSDEKPTGPLMLQGDHGPVAYRNIWLRPLEK